MMRSGSWATSGRRSPNYYRVERTSPSRTTGTRPSVKINGGCRGEARTAGRRRVPWSPRRPRGPSSRRRHQVPHPPRPQRWANTEQILCVRNRSLPRQPDDRDSDRPAAELVDRCDPAAPVMRGVNSPLFIGGALIRDPRAVPNLCKADSGLSAMISILAACRV